jgi:riboflavin kinase/FMN adenylyltransferase
MTRRSVITIGNFDGVHRGHQSLLAAARQRAAADGARVIALSFRVNPLTLLRPHAAPPGLCTPDQKRALLLAAGADEVELLEPSAELLSQSPRQFIEDVVRRHAPLALVEGPDFRFGRDRSGGLDELESLGRELGFAVIRMPRQEVVLHDLLQVPVNSSLIRWLLSHGRVADAAIGLSRPYRLTSSIIRGHQRGRTIGVPTANLDLQALAGQMIPGVAVYAGAAQLPDGARYAAAISVGVNPTFHERVLTVEAHLLDFQGDLYNQTVALEFHRWLRDQQTFAHVEQLRAQLQRDIQRTRWNWRGARTPAAQLTSQDSPRP